MSVVPVVPPRAYVMHTYGDFMDLKLRCLSIPGIDQRDFLFVPHVFKDMLDFSEGLISSYKTQARLQLGIDIWIPDPMLRHVCTIADGVKEDFYWLHTGRTNHHRREYVSDYLVHTIPLERALSYLFAPNRQAAIRGLMDMANKLNASHL